MIYLQMFWEFFKAGLFAVGGGLATLPFLSEMGDRFGWFTSQQLADMVAVSESTPGPIGVNMATYVGYSIKGIPGGIVATIGLVAPSVIIILIIAGILDKFRTNKYVDRAFYGIRPVSTAMIGAALIGLICICMFGVKGIPAVIQSGSINVKAWLLFAVLMVLTNLKKLKKLHPLAFIALAAVCGIVFEF